MVEKVQEGLFQHPVRNSGFTFIEVLVALAVGSIALLSFYGVLMSVLGAGERTGGSLERDLEAGMFLDRLSGEVNSAYFSPEEPRTAFSGKTRAGASALEFTSYSAEPQREGAPSTDLMAIGYFAKHEDGGLTLYRETWNPHIGERFVSEALSGIEAFELSYSNGTAWANAWEASLEKKLPLAVRARVVLRDGREFTALSRTMIR
ncbi:MAG: prepilin-type N-terminal cleavage/methylation domain-containing protein [Deltaproteobacteria bacterium]|nr:prepilin-type N-terminal cleavage/methylation domain-containing protein [Deltaproteobacteria bacterium]MCL4874183.1 prepilin-type N-terminal cleavage/methylation domain-containing protein [bacterium]